MFRNDGARARRRGFPISGSIGPNGSGKTVAMVWDTLPSLEAGRPVLSTVRLLDYQKPRPCDDDSCTSPDHALHGAAHPLWIPFHSWSQLLEVEHCDVLADEITGVASSRESQSLPAVIANSLVQLRRRDVVFRWTSPSWARADTIIRECSQAVTLCKGYLPVTVPSDDGLERVWKHKRMFRWTTYDAILMGEFTEGKREKLTKLQFDMHWGPGSPAFAAFDTFDSVLSVGLVSDSGRCLTCNGRRTAPACSCAEYKGRSRSRATHDEI